ncbi:aminotransferase class I/II-fold pyridoxal phosphate-dependent enzyme [Candidatus Falkowbacteria bacterium]|nr:aminotransferase class I/II-fold pyridoxal phosphate-dependent enzyme [Candidatus Falkowbacteria bacterium]
MSKRERAFKDPLRHLHPSTALSLAGYSARFSERSAKVPLFRTSTFEFASAAEGKLFFDRAYHLPGDDGVDPGLVYSRLNNPNTEIVEDKIVAAEAGSNFAAAFPSGMNAITTTILALVPRGGKILYGNPVYGGTYFFLKHICPERFDVKTVPVDSSDLELFEDTLKKEGPFSMVFLETPANPTMKLTDIRAVADLAKKHSGEKVIVVVDNTFLGPVFQQPFECGADIVVYSATKYIGGHSDLIAGFALTRDKAQMMTIKDFRTILGGTISSDTAWLLTRSVETLWMRMERQAEVAAKVAQALKVHPAVSKVYFPGLLRRQDGKAYEIYRKQCLGPGAMITFDLKAGTMEAAYKFLDAVEICHLAVSLGGTESLIEHPRTMTHSDMTEEDLDLCGITNAMVRLSIGLENSDDLIADIFNALKEIE